MPGACAFHEEQFMPDDYGKRIAQLNDTFRQTFRGGQVLITRGVQALGRSRVRRAITTVQMFSRFTENNDPYGEHDFGNFEIDGESLYWKIDYYTRPLDWGNPLGSTDPSDPSRTTRVLTILLASEY